MTNGSLMKVESIAERPLKNRQNNELNDKW